MHVKLKENKTERYMMNPCHTLVRRDGARFNFLQNALRSRGKLSPYSDLIRALSLGDRFVHAQNGRHGQASQGSQGDHGVPLPTKRVSTASSIRSI